jgi:hypothetical protein
MPAQLATWPVQAASGMVAMCMQLVEEAKDPLPHRTLLSCIQQSEGGLHAVDPHVQFHRFFGMILLWVHQIQPFQAPRSLVKGT